VVLVKKRIKLAAECFYDRPTLLLRKMRKSVANARNEYPELARAELVDIGFLREKETVHMTLYFNSETQC